DGDVELLEHLETQAAGPGPPEVFEPGPGLRLLRRLAGVAGVDEDVRVNEERHGRGARRVRDRATGDDGASSPPGRDRRASPPRTALPSACAPEAAPRRGGRRWCRAGPLPAGPSGPCPRRG